MNVVIVNCFDTYEQRVILLQKYFHNRNWNVSIVTSNYRHIQKSFRKDTIENFIFIPVIPYSKNMSISRLVSHMLFSVDAFKKVENLNPDLLWVLSPPNSVIKYASQYKQKKPRITLIIDIIDIWPETMPISKVKRLFPFSLWRSLRDKYINLADIVITECNLFKDLLYNICDISKIYTLYLAKGEQTLESSPNPPADRYALCYLGSINNIIDIPCICNIIKSMPKKEKVPELHIIGDGEKRNILINEAIKAGAKVIYYGKIYDPKEKQIIMDKCHLGLNIMKPSVFVGLTMKSMDYFQAGIPIVNNIQGDTWDMVQQYNLGINYNNQNISDMDLNKILVNRESIKKFFRDKLSVDTFYQTLTSILEESNCK